MTNGMNDMEEPPCDRLMKRYKTIEEAKADGWVLLECVFPTKYVYYCKDGVIKQREELIEPPVEKP